MKFKGRRVDGWIALYVYGIHGCHDYLPSRGLKGEAKVRADAAVLSGRRSDSVFDSFNREKSSEMKKLLSTEGQEHPIKEKRKQTWHSRAQFQHVHRKLWWQASASNICSPRK